MQPIAGVVRSQFIHKLSICYLFVNNRTSAGAYNAIVTAVANFRILSIQIVIIPDGRSKLFEFPGLFGENAGEL